MLHVRIGDLPKKLSMSDAVEACYQTEIRFIWSRLKEGISVKVRCEKQIIPYLEMILKRRLTAEGKSVAIIDGRPQPGQQAPSSRIAGIVDQLRTLVNNTEPGKVFFLPYLDILTSTTQALSNDGREIMTIIHENPLLVLATFEDPDFPLPEMIAQAFPARVELLGIDRHRLSGLMTAEEAGKFGREELNLMQVYKYVSGLNPVRFREIMRIFAGKADYDPAVPAQLTGYLHELREYTATGGVALSGVNLEKDIAGYAGVKQRIEENILSLLRAASKLSDEQEIGRLESIIPRGLIFHGPPGTGKTLFAKGIAEALNAAIYIVSGPELKSKWVGEGEANIRRLFARARATAPSVIVFDELDSIASARVAGASDGGSQAAHSMVNQLLTEMDGFRKEELVLVIGTTNFIQSLDPAFLRPGRFEEQIQIPYPEWEDRRAILDCYNRKFSLGLSDADLEMLAGWTGRLTDAGTPYSGDHLNALLRGLKRHLLHRGLVQVTPEVLQAWLRTLAGVRPLDPEEERVVATHECGHALMYFKAGRMGDIKKVTIESGSANVLGMVCSETHKPNLYFTEARLRSEIAISLGGYAAEKLIFSEVSTGASADLSHATMVAQDMVVRYGMGPAAVPRSYVDANDRPEPYFTAQLSPKVDALLTSLLAETEAWLTERRPLLESMAKLLVEKRTLHPEDLKKILV